MSVTLRFQRHGSKNSPFYHLVAADHRKPRDCKFIEKLGYYDPAAEPSLIEFKEERVRFWYGQGAELSNTVDVLFKKKGLKLERKKTHVARTAPKKTKTK